MENGHVLQNGDFQGVASTAHYAKAPTDKESRICHKIPPKPYDDKDTEHPMPHVAFDSIMSHSAPLPPGSMEIRGYDWSKGLDYHGLLRSFVTSGFQAANFGKAADVINAMLKERSRPTTTQEQSALPNHDESGRPRSACTIFLGFTSNMISSGVRETLKFIAQHNMVDVLVTTAGGIEEDIIKCFAPTYSGDFRLDGNILYGKGHNRIGNMILPNSNYSHFRDFLHPIIDSMLKEQIEDGVRWTPSKIIHRLGKEINHEDSVLYWAYKNNIPVFCPGFSDGSLGDMMYMYSYQTRGFIVDIVEDIRYINNLAVSALKSGIIILGGGAAKHHICNANCMRTGADYAVFINSGTEYDGSDSGARPDEAVSWGKIRINTSPVKIYGDASIIFPLMVAETFYRHHTAAKVDSKA